MLFTGPTLTDSPLQRQPFKRQAAVLQCTQDVANPAKSSPLKGDTFDVKYRTYPDTDTISVYFAKATPGVISHSGELVPGILVDYNKTERIVCVDIDTSMAEMPYHLFDVPDQIDSKPPFVLKPKYDAATDKLVLSFDATPATFTKEIPTEDPDVTIGVGLSGAWRAIMFRRAHVRLLVPTMGWVDKSE